MITAVQCIYTYITVDVCLLAATVGLDFMMTFGNCLARDPSRGRHSPTAKHPLSLPHTTEDTVTVFLHYSDNVYLKLIATVEEVKISSTTTVPTVSAPYRSHIPLPPPHDHQIEKRATSDYVIIAIIVTAMALGSAVGLWKTGLMQRCCMPCCCSDRSPCAPVGHTERQLHRRIVGGSWRDSPLYGNGDDRYDGSGDEGVHIHHDDMDNASHGFQKGQFHQQLGKSANQAMTVDICKGENGRRGSGSTSGSGDGSSRPKSKSQLVHEAIMKAATGRGGRESGSVVQYSHLRIDDDDDDFF